MGEKTIRASIIDKTDLSFQFQVGSSEVKFTGRLRWGKDGTLQQEVATISYPTGVNTIRLARGRE